MEEGYLLCCFNDIKYFKMTVRTVHMIRKYDIVRKICILTDNPSYFENQLFYRNSLDADNKVVVVLFDYKQHMHDTINMQNNWNRYGLIPKIYQSYYTPFQKTMYIDVDMMFKKDLTCIWDIYARNGQPILFAGVSDVNNKAPANWHWNRINEVANNVGIHIPQCFSTLMVYNTQLKTMVETHICNIFHNLLKWKIRMQYKNGCPDEIIYAIIFGFEKIKPDKTLHELILNTNMCNPFDKNV